MKRLLTMCAVAALVLALGTSAEADEPTGWIKNGDFSAAAAIEWDTGLDGFEHWRPEAYQTHLDLDKDGTPDEVADLPSPNARSKVKSSKGQAVEDGAPEQFLELLKHAVSCQKQ